MNTARTGRPAPGPRRLSALLLLLPTALLGCAKGPPPARTPATEPASSEAPASARPGSAEPAAPLTLPALGAGLPAPPASCPAATSLPLARGPCSSARADLARALATPPASSDAALAKLEACTDFPAGVVRALRAERLPLCADQLVQPVLAQADAGGAPAGDPNGVAPALRPSLLALGLAARLSRLVGPPPSAPPRSSKVELEAYLKDQLFPWAAEQAKAIFDLSRAGAELRGYGRGLVAIEAALADLRFVEMARALPLPTEMQAADVQAEYFAALDEALEPRKDRARDAALVGLGEFSALGISKSARLDQARQVIARVFAGNRILALDLLLVPPAPKCASTTPEEVIAASVESPYATSLLAAVPPTPALRTCLLTRGLSLDLARQLEADAAGTSRSALARAYFELGRTYMNSAAFQRAATLYAGSSADTGPQAEEDALLSALSSLLTAVPANAAELFRVGPRLPSALGETTRLDELSRSRSNLAGAAAFDAAYLRELAAADGSVSHFQEVGKRYELARQLLSGTERTLAADRGRAAQATAQALAKQLK
jgi:hypothetical protein